MKKTILIIATMVAFVMSANAQLFDFSSNIGRVGIGVQGGQSMPKTEYSEFGFGLSLQMYGVQVDFINVVPAHKYDNHVTNTLYRDSASFNINLGYQIPVLPWLRIMPMIGYSQTNYGDTDATTVNIDADENTATMYHDYDVVSGSRQHYFNYGVGLSLTPFKYVDIYGVYSAQAIYGGIAINLNAFRDR